MIIPESIIRQFPKYMQDNPDDGTTALADKIDSIFQAINTDIDALNTFKDPVQCPASYLVEIGNLLNAGILSQDSETIRRNKISIAIATHKKRGQWAGDAKLKIDAITGYDARILASVDSDDWILLGDSDDPDYYWATMGADGIDNNLGLALVGEGTEIYIAGNIYIDCHYGVHTPVLTAAQIAHIVLEIQYDVIPAYFIINLGYIDTGGSFVIYAGGTI
jgi:hypothetical protein